MLTENFAHDAGRLARISELALRAGLILPPASSLDVGPAEFEIGASDPGRRSAVVVARGTPAVATAPEQKSAWSDRELDDSILRLCDEFPEAPMAACSRALEYCRRSTPRGTPESLLAEMRNLLCLDMARGLRCAA